MRRSIFLIHVLIVSLSTSAFAQKRNFDQDSDPLSPFYYKILPNVDEQISTPFEEQYALTNETRLSLKVKDILAETQLACERQDNGLNAANKTFLVKPVLGTQDYKYAPEDQRSLEFDRATKLAMNYIYSKTYSSNEAKFKVSNVLKKYNCNSSIPEQIEYKEWIGQDINSGLKTHIAVTTPDLNEISYQTSPIEERWKSLGFTSECSQTRNMLEGICAGELTPRMLFDELKSQNIKDENQDAFGIGELVGQLIDFAYQVYRDIKTDNDRHEAAKLIVKNNELAQDNDVLRNINNDLQKNFEKTFMESLDKIFNDPELTPTYLAETADSLEQLRKYTYSEQQRNINIIRKNNKKIKENTIQILSVVPYQYKPPETKDPENSDSEIATEKKENKIPSDDKKILYPSENEEIAFAHFVESKWKLMQQELVYRSNACYKSSFEMMGPRTSFKATSPEVSGETCNFDLALEELTELVPALYESTEIFILNSGLETRVQNAIMNMPICDIFQPCSQEFMDQYYKSQGFDGGEAEFCTVSKSDCDNNLLYFQAQDIFPKKHNTPQN
jgi:hypothetical protein